MNPTKIIKFNEKGDETGFLIALEQCKEIPFELKRIFYIYETDNTVARGNHANKDSEFLFICLTGSCKVKYVNDGEEIIVVLDSPDMGLYMNKMVWKTMYDFSKGSILLVLTNTIYNPEEYIYDYDAFLKLKNRGE
jgi:dTDP-4-dehydrorhamnose 3,5-epimerase-like enzyme